MDMVSMERPHDDAESSKEARGSISRAESRSTILQAKASNLRDRVADLAEVYGKLKDSPNFDKVFHDNLLSLKQKMGIDSQVKDDAASMAYNELTKIPITTTTVEDTVKKALDASDETARNDIERVDTAIKLISKSVEICKNSPESIAEVNNTFRTSECDEILYTFIKIKSDEMVIGKLIQANQRSLESETNGGPLTVEMIFKNISAESLRDEFFGKSPVNLDINEKVSRPEIILPEKKTQANSDASEPITIEGSGHFVDEPQPKTTTAEQSNFQSDVGTGTAETKTKIDDKPQTQIMQIEGRITSAWLKHAKEYYSYFERSENIPEGTRLEIEKDFKKLDELTTYYPFRQGKTPHPYLKEGSMEIALDLWKKVNLVWLENTKTVGAEFKIDLAAKFTGANNEQAALSVSREALSHHANYYRYEMISNFINEYPGAIYNKEYTLEVIKELMGRQEELRILHAKEVDDEKRKKIEEELDGLAGEIEIELLDPDSQKREFGGDPRKRVKLPFLKRVEGVVKEKIYTSKTMDPQLHQFIEYFNLLNQKHSAKNYSDSPEMWNYVYKMLYRAYTKNMLRDPEPIDTGIGAVPLSRPEPATKESEVSAPPVAFAPPWTDTTPTS